MKIPKIKNLRQIVPMALLCLMLVVIMILKLKIPTTNIEPTVIETNTNPVAVDNNTNLKTTGKLKTVINSNVSIIDVPKIENEIQKKRVYDEAIQAIIDVEKIKFGDANLANSDSFNKVKDKQYWWDLVNLFGREMIQAKKDDFTLNNYLEENKIKTEVGLNKEQQDFAVSLEVPNSKTVTSTQGDYIQYEFDQSTIVQYQLIDNRLKENIIYNFKPNDNFFYFNIDKADNLEVIPKDDGGIIFQTVSEPKHIVATVLPPTIVDRKGNIGKMSLEYQNNRFKYIIDQSWMAKASYPVVVDPTLQMGAVLYYTGGTVNVEWFGDGSDYRNTGTFLYKDEVSLYSPIQQYLISNIDYQDCNPSTSIFQLCNKGTASFNLGDQYIGQELKFGNQVYQTNTVYYTGPASRNPDNQVHAVIVYEESFNAYVIKFIRSHPAPTGTSNTESVAIWLTGGLSDSPPPVDPTPVISPEPILSGLTCNNNTGAIKINFDTTGFSSIATYAIKFVNGETQYLQADNTLGNTEVFQTKAGWGNIVAQGLVAGANYNISISAKPDGIGTALVYSMTKNTTEICGGETFYDQGQICGDGTIQFPEQCDDNNTNDGDGCDHTCNLEPATASDPPTVDIKVNGSDNPSPFPNNSTIGLSWSSTNADSCTASGNWSGSKSTSGSENQGPLTTGSYTYTIQCQNTAGTTTDSVTVRILSPCDINYSYSTDSTTEVSTVSNHWHGTVCVNRQLNVASGNTLTIDPGTVVKFYIGDNNQRWGLTVNGTININGTENNQVYFTSYRDNSVGNKVSSSSSTPLKGDWSVLYFSANSSNPATGTINYGNFRYGSEIDIMGHSSTTGRIAPNFNYSTFERFAGYTTFYVEHSSPILNSTTVRNNTGYAFLVDPNKNSNINFYGNTVVENNGLNAVLLNGWYWGNMYCQDVSSNYTWYNDVPYVMGGMNNNCPDIAITSQLKLEPGTIIKISKVSDATRTTIRGSLIADGTAENPIYITSLKDDSVGRETHPDWFDADGNCIQGKACDTNADGSATGPYRGDWNQFYFGPNTDTNPGYGLLNYTNIRYGAGNMILVYAHNTTNRTNITISNSILEYSSGNALYVELSSPYVHDVIFRNNSGYAIQLLPDKGNIDFTGDNVAENNGINGIYTSKSYSGCGSCGNVNTNRTWYNDIPYIIQTGQGTSDTIDAELTLEPGTIIKFNSGQKMTINKKLLAEGTAQEPIYFTSIKDDSVGREVHPEWFDADGECITGKACDTNGNGSADSPAPGDWNQINMTAGTNEAFGSFKHTIIKYGSNKMINITTHNTNNKPNPTFSDTVFEYSSGNAFYVSASNPTVNNVVSRHNNGYAFAIDVSPTVISNIEFTGNNLVESNGLNGVMLASFYYGDAGCGSFSTDRNWYKDIPYVFSGTGSCTMTINSQIKPQAGTIIKFSPGVKLLVNQNFITEGTAEQPVYMTSLKDDTVGKEIHPEWFDADGNCLQGKACDTNNDGSSTTPARGDWNQISFFTDCSNGCRPATGNLNHTIIRYGSNNMIFVSGHNSPGYTEPTFNNSVLEYSSGNAFYASRSNPTVNNLDIHDNNGYAYLMNNPIDTNIEFTGDNNLAYNNSLNGIGITDFTSDYNTNYTWYKDLPYVIVSSSNSRATIAADLTLEPGAIIKFNSGMSMIATKKLSAFGSPENPIFFTSFKDDTVGIETHPEWFSNGICKNNYPCDTNNNGTATAPAKEDWGGVLYSGSTANGQISNTTFRYGAGGTGNYDYELAFDGVTANTVEVKNSNFNYTNRGLYANNSLLNVHNNSFDSSSDYGVVINNPPTGFVFDHNIISHFDTGILLTNISQGLNLTNNTINNTLTGVWGQGISSNGVMMTGNNIDAANYFIRNDSTPFVSGSCTSPSTSTTINACVANNWGSYPVSDYPPGQIYKNPGNILYNNYGVVVTAPNGSEIWRPHSTHNITWTTYNTGGNSRYADLYYSVDNGVNWSLIAQNVDHQGDTILYGEYAWNLPNSVSAQTLVKVIIKDVVLGNLASDISNNVFLIGSSSPQLSDNLSTVRTSQPARHDILYTNDIANDSSVSDGSIKFDLADEFDFSGVTISDLAIRGGDVSWGIPTINQTDRTVVYPFFGSMSKIDGSIILTLGETNKPHNPVLAGDYTLNVGLYQSNDGTGVTIEEAQAQVNINDGLIIEVDIPTTLEVSINSLPSGTNVNGAATNTATTSSAIEFGHVTGGENKIAAHELVISTNNANGYQAQIKYSGPFAGPIAINDFTGTNADPTIWLAPNNNGYFGYTTDNANLKNGSNNRFTGNGGNKWAGFTTDYKEVAAANEPIENQTTKVGYRFNLADNFGISGVYQTEIMYFVNTSY